MQYARLCNLLSMQGLDVVCATISMFDKCREWNRSNLKNYFEIYLKVSQNELQKRNQKKLYSQVLKKTIKNVVGVDISFEEPKNPDLIIQNDGKKTAQELCKYIFNYLTSKGIK